MQVCRCLVLIQSAHEYYDMHAVLVTTLALAVLIPGSVALRCKTGTVTRDCNTCWCDEETGELLECTLMGCIGPKWHYECRQGHWKLHDSGHFCECSGGYWYCDITM